MDNYRLILFVALAFVLMLIWQAWERERPSAPPVAEVPTQAVTPEAAIPAAPALPGAASPAAEPKSLAFPRADRIEVLTDVVRAEIDTAGGDLRRLWLLKHPVSVDQPDEPIALLKDAEQETFIAQSGIVGHTADYPTHKARFQAAEQRYVLGNGQQELRVPLSWRATDGTRYTKSYVFRRDSYVVTVEYTVENPGKREWIGYPYGQLVRSYVERPGLFAIPTYTGGAIYTPEDKYQKISFDDMAAKPLKRDTEEGWIAILQHYFVGAWIADAAKNEFYTDVLPGQRYVIGSKALIPARVAPGETGRIAMNLYVGPKEQDRLEQIAPGLELTVDYGWLTVISAPLFWLLQLIHGWVGNWGWAIVILTVLIKLVFYPLSAASYKSMAHMRKLQPKMASLKERYGDDRQKLNQAMMELYKTEKINPLGGCLPIVIQIPVFIALYWVLLESVEMRQAPFVLWIRDLSTPDPYFVLPVIMGASMYIQQWLNPQPADPIQKKVFMFLPVVFSIFFLFFPAGLVLYWVVNNLLSIAQQWRITRVIEAKAS
jgi:YidC/Oxa1 family membrane protein insertase